MTHDKSRPAEPKIHLFDASGLSMLSAAFMQARIDKLEAENERLRRIIRTRIAPQVVVAKPDVKH